MRRWRGRPSRGGPHCAQVTSVFRRNSGTSLPRPITAEERPGAEAIGLIASVIAECGTEDPVAATLCLWAGLHGLVTLRHARPYVPWPDEDTLLATLLRGYAPEAP